MGVRCGYALDCLVHMTSPQRRATVEFVQHIQTQTDTRAHTHTHPPHKLKVRWEIKLFSQFTHKIYGAAFPVTHAHRGGKHMHARVQCSKGFLCNISAGIWYCLLAEANSKCLTYIFNVFAPHKSSQITMAGSALEATRSNHRNCVVYVCKMATLTEMHHGVFTIQLV